MTPYFNNPTHLQQLTEELNSWIGTPFEYDMAGVAANGYYADCASFPLAVYTNMGLYTENVSLPKYRSTKGGSIQIGYIENVIEKNINNIQKIWKCGIDLQLPQIIPGDIIVLKLGERVQHIAIYEGKGICVDCWPRDGVRKVLLDSRLQRYFYSIYRIYEKK